MYIVNLSQDHSRENKYLSTTLLAKIENHLKNQKKTLLYLNKRGSFESLICEKCSTIYYCENCDTSLSIHGPSMICHLCGFSKEVPKKCEKCNHSTLNKVGV